jgi:hypothetical protein
MRLAHAVQPITELLCSFGATCALIAEHLDLDIVVELSLVYCTYSGCVSRTSGEVSLHGVELIVSPPLSSTFGEASYTPLKYGESVAVL